MLNYCHSVAEGGPSKLNQNWNGRNLTCKVISQPNLKNLVKRGVD